MRALAPLAVLLVLAMPSAHAADAPTPPPPAPAPPQPLAFTVDRWLAGPSLVGRGPSFASWRPGRDAWVRWSNAGGARTLVEVDARTGAETTLLAMADVDALRPDERPIPLEGIGRAAGFDHAWARDGDVLVVSTGGDLVRVDLAAGTRRRLTHTTSPIADVQVAPDGTAVAFSRDHELHLAEVDGDDVRERPLTQGGSATHGNATLDWVYPEELEASTAIAWSPDSRRIAYLRLDEARVPEMALGDPMPLHGAVTRQRYPKAGDPNPVASVYVVGRGQRAADAPVRLDLGASADAYVPWFTWTPDGRRVLVAVQTRDQTTVELRICDPAGGPPIVWWRDTDPRWVDVPPPPRFLADRTVAILRSRRGGWWRLWRVPLADGAPLALTPDGADASAPLAIDATRDVVFYATERRDTLRTVVERVPLAGGAPTLVSDAEHTHDAEVSPTGRVWIDHASRADRPPVWTLRGADGAAVRELADATTDAWRAAALPAPELRRLAGDPELVVSIRRPRAFDPARRWPVLFHVYGGPGSRMVRDAFTGAGFDTVLAELGCVVVQVDGRGTAGRGKDFEATVHRRLGTCEVEDLVAAVERLAVEPWFDRARVGVWGWSYGGYLAALAAVRAPGTFTSAVAVAPVTDWRLYDSIYTERYMDLPAENEEGYRIAAPTTWAKGLTGSLLLAHGLADDNVHAQNTWRFVDALVEAGRPFDLQVYPGCHHGIEGAGPHAHVHRRIVEHVRRTLVDVAPTR